jgi:hypothetical protein
MASHSSLRVANLKQSSRKAQDHPTISVNLESCIDHSSRRHKRDRRVLHHNLAREVENLEEIREN